MQLTIKPMDTFFFRDGKPFSRGEQTEASAIFPPFPSTLYGALRTAYISQKGWQKFSNGEFSNEIGTFDTHGNFKIKGVFLIRKGAAVRVYFPLPRDLVVKKRHGENDNKARKLKLVECPKFSSGQFEKILVSQESDVEFEEHTFFDSVDLKSHLLKGFSSPHQYTVHFKDDYLFFEPKVGIERELQTLKNKEGHLYRVGMMRLNSNAKYEFLVDATELDLAEKGIIKIGGENKSFYYEKNSVKVFEYSDDEKKEVIKNIDEKKEFKLYCATPTIWNEKNGEQAWLAEWMLGNSKYQNRIKCDLITAAVGKYVNVGGWDLYKKAPKAMYRAVPAGSVYYLRLIEGTGEDVFNLFHYKNNSVVRANEGFGLTLVGLI